jgi:glycosyltransferase involved in cell wall biosynthesis
MRTSAPLLTSAHAGAAAPPANAQVDLVIPVTSQQRDLALTVIRLHDFLPTAPFSARVTIADGGTSDATRATATGLAASFPEVSVIHSGAPGREAALRAAWLRSRSEVVAYLDTDLSVDPAALVPLVAPLLAGECDLAVGTRLAPGARPLRSPRRQVLSCGYSLLVQCGLGTGLADVQCGFKAMTRASALDLLPLTSETGWFLDSQLIALASRAGLRIREVAVNGYGGARGRPGRRTLRSVLSRRAYHGNVA